MNKQNIEKEVINIVKDVYNIPRDSETITLKTNFKTDLKPDRFDFCFLMCEIEDNFDIEISDEKDFKTVEDFVNYIDSIENYTPGNKKKKYTTNKFTSFKYQIIATLFLILLKITNLISLNWIAVFIPIYIFLISFVLFVIFSNIFKVIKK